MAASYLSNATGTAEPVGFDPKVSTESKLIKQPVRYIFNMKNILAKTINSMWYSGLFNVYVYIGKQFKNITGRRTNKQSNQ